MDDFSYIGVIGIVQHKVTIGLDFEHGVLDAFSPGASVHQDQIEGVIGMDVDGSYILMDSCTHVVVIVDEAGTL
jgi:hypothetical protein